jgi:outer membrane protein assembly factor BamB
MNAKKLILVLLTITAGSALFYLAGPGRKIHSDTSSGNASAFQKLWEFNTGSRCEGSLAVSDDGTLIAACLDGFVYALDSSGKLQWKTYVGATVASPTIGSDGAIYIPNNNGAVFALNRSGTQRWKSIVYPGNTMGYNAGAIGRSMLYSPSRDGLKAISLSDGRVEWSTDLGTDQHTSVTLMQDGTILFGGHGRLNAVNAEGDTLWQYPPVSEEALHRNGGYPPPGDFFVSSGITPGPDRLLLAGVGRSSLAAVGQDGALHWHFESRGTTLNMASPVIASDGTIYFLHSNGHLYAFDSFGNQKWDLDTHNVVNATPLLAADGTIFILANRNLCAVSPAGQILAQVDTGNTVVSSPTITPEGTIYVVNESGVIGAYAGGHGGLMDSPWPKFQGDLANTGNSRTY